MTKVKMTFLQSTFKENPMFLNKNNSNKSQANYPLPSIIIAQKLIDNSITVNSRKFKHKNKKTMQHKFQKIKIKIHLTSFRFKKFLNQIVNKNNTHKNHSLKYFKGLYQLQV